MTQAHRTLRCTRILALLLAGALAPAGPAWAQDGWSFVITPQVWVSHISQNGLAPATNLGFFGDIIQPGDTTQVNGVNPQWGLQVAAQKGRWSLAGSFQYTTFETRTDLVNGTSDTLCIPPQAGGFSCLNFPSLALGPGQTAAQEFVDTTRMDFDLALSYFFPDVVRDLMDLSVGGGVKFIYASSSRSLQNQSQFLADFGSLLPPTGNYLVCPTDDCATFEAKDRVKATSYFYGATLPTSAVFHLTKDKRWLLPFNVTPFIGAETSDDKDVVYKINTDSSGNFVSVDRQDGTTFAYGVTADATVRYLFNDVVSMYAGMRVQYIEGRETFLAYGPLVGLSVRLGGK